MFQAVTSYYSRYFHFWKWRGGVVTLVWRKKLDSTVAVLIIVPMDEFFNPGPGIIKGSKAAIGIA
jgi:hypothetical protein